MTPKKKKKSAAGEKKPSKKAKAKAAPKKSKKPAAPPEAKEEKPEINVHGVEVIEKTRKTRGKSIPKEAAKNVIEVTVEDQMKSAYIDYSMSVIVGRALPDVRDGLKPVHRRILYSMDELGLQPGKPYKKSARIVGECFIKDTLVLAEQGLVPIQEIDCGDQVYTQRGKRKVTALYEMPEKELLKVTLNNGTSNTVTPAQKIKVLNESLQFVWKEARELTLKDYIVARACFPEIKKEAKLKRPKDLFAPKRLNAQLAYLLGLWLSDGWIEENTSRRGSARLCFFSTSQPTIKKIGEILETEFKYKGTIEKKKPTRGKKDYKTGYMLRINRKAINDFLILNFALSGRKSATKEVPSQVFCSPARVIFAFVSGLMDGDGSIHASRSVVHYGSVSEKLISGLQVLLQHLQVLTMRYEEQPHEGGEIAGHKISGKQKFFYLEARGANAARLGKDLCLSNGDKRERINRLLSEERKQVALDIIPFLSEAVFRELSNKHRGAGWYQDAAGQAFRQGIKYPGGSKVRYSEDLREKPLRRTQVVEWGIKEKLKRIGSSLHSLLEEIIINKLYFIQVASIQKVSPQKTYDIQVEGEHEFIANGMLSHNCLGKYHPHGDTAVYESMVRMAQDFSLRYMLVDGQGNFGSVDGDSAASLRYTEARLSKLAVEMLADLEKETVPFGPNFDESLEEPLLLPSRIPNLLVNGSAGIAVGMATNIPPHNLTEVVDGAVALIDDPELSMANLMKIVRGPDFPTGALICGRAGIKQAHETGRGSVIMRAKTQIEEARAGKHAIIVTELPYQVNKASLIEHIADLVKDKKIKGISDLRDESDRAGMRIYIETRKDANVNIILNQLFKRTDMQSSFGVNMVALVDGVPLQINLKQALLEYIKHREEVVTKRAKFDLKKAQEQAHILEGLLIAVSNIDKIINLIKKSKNPAEAKTGLMKKFKLSAIQAQAILDLRLHRLTQLERYKIDQDYKALKKKIKELKELLASKKKISGVVKNELGEVKDKYGDERRSKIIGEIGEVAEEELIQDSEVAILLTRDGFIKRMPITTFRAQMRGGRGVSGMSTRQEDEIDKIFVASTLSYLLFFTNKGKVYKIKVYELPESSRAGKGQAIPNVLELGMGEVVTAAIPVKEFGKETFIVMATRNGLIKKTEAEAFANIRRTGITAIKLKGDDELRWVRATGGKEEVILCTKNGLMIRFTEKLVRPMGRAAAGVKGISLRKGDHVVTMDILEEGTDLLAVSADGFGKRMRIKEFGAQNRGGKGHIAMKLRKEDEVAKMTLIHKNDEILFVSAKGTMLRQTASGISTQGRYAKGVRLQRLDKDDYIVDLARVVKAEEEVEKESAAGEKEKAAAKKKK